MKKIKVAVIGLNHAGCDFHLPGLSTFEDIELSLCDINEARLRSAGEQFGVGPEKRYTDYRRLLGEEEPDAVFVLMAQYATRTENDRCEVVRSTRSRAAYFEIVPEVLRQKRAVFVEKPLAMTPTEALPLVRAAERAGVVTMVGENRRFNPLVQACRQRVLARGPMLNVNCHFYKCEPARRKVRMQNGREEWLADDGIDWLTGDMIHALYLMRHLGGGEIIEFSSTVSKLPGDSGPTAFSALARFERGTTGTFCSNVRAGARREVWQMHGVGISAYLETIGGGPGAPHRMRAQVYTDNDLEHPEILYDDEAAGSTDYRQRQGFTAADRTFIDCVRDGRQPHCNFADHFKTIALCARLLAGGVMTVSAPHGDVADRTQDGQGVCHG